MRSERIGHTLVLMRAALAMGGRNPTMLIVGLVMPVMIITVVGLVFGSGSPRLPIAVVDRDQGALADDLFARFERDGRIEARRVSSTAAAQSPLRRGRVFAAIEIPAGYTDRLLSGRRAAIVSIAVTGRTEGLEARAAVMAAVSRQSVAIDAARVAAVVEHPPGPARAAAERRYLARALSTTAGWPDPEGETRSPFSYTAPSNTVLFVFMAALAASIGAVRRRQLGITSRLRALPVTTGSLVAAEVVGAIAFSAAQAALLVGVGRVLFGVQWGDGVAVTAVTGAVVLVSAAAGLVLGTSARAPEQAVALIPALGISLGMLGGCMWPLSSVGPVLRQVGHLAPHAWAMDAYLETVYSHATVADVALPIGVLLAMAAALGAIGFRRLRRGLVH